ncbi:hypothetical protein GH733_006149, partial [Mirounga leonina]
RQCAHGQANSTWQKDYGRTSGIETYIESAHTSGQTWHWGKLSSTPTPTIIIIVVVILEVIQALKFWFLFQVHGKTIEVQMGTCRRMTIMLTYDISTSPQGNMCLVVYNNAKYITYKNAIPRDEARDLAKENSVSLLETSTLHSTKVEWANNIYVLMLLFGLNDTIFKASLNGGLEKGRNTPFPFQGNEKQLLSSAEDKESGPNARPQASTGRKHSLIPSTSFPTSDPRPRASSNGLHLTVTVIERSIKDKQ